MWGGSVWWYSSGNSRNGGGSQTSDRRQWDKGQGWHRCHFITACPNPTELFPGRWNNTTCLLIMREALCCSHKSSKTCLTRVGEDQPIHDKLLQLYPTYCILSKMLCLLWTKCPSVINVGSVPRKWACLHEKIALKSKQKLIHCNQPNLQTCMRHSFFCQYCCYTHWNECFVQISVLLTKFLWNLIKFSGTFSFSYGYMLWSSLYWT